MACLWNWTLKSSALDLRNALRTKRFIANHIANKSNEMLDAWCYDILVNLFELES